MNIILVFPNIYTPLTFSPAIQILSSVLKAHNHIVKLIHINKEIIPNNITPILNDVKKHNPDLIGFTSTSFEYDRCNEIAGVIKKEMNIPIILGGVHATISPEDYPSSNFDAFIIGEGESVVLDIADKRIEPKGLIKGNTVQNLDSLPFHDWDLMNTEKILQYNNGWVHVGFSRGCPFDCAFCANASLNKIKNIGKKIRKRSPKLCIDELLYIISKFNINVINFADDEFILDNKWLKEFLLMYKENIYDKKGIKFVIEARVDTFSDKKAKLLKECGCREIQFGVETGSERLRYLLNKKISDNRIIRAFNICRKYGIHTYAYMMMGIPTETEKDLKCTSKFLSIIKPNLIRPTFLCPVKGTNLYDYCLDNNLIKKSVNVWNYESPLQLKTLNDEILTKYWCMYPWYINSYLGLEIYEKEIEKFSKLDLRKDYDYQQLINRDTELSSYMKKQEKQHYSYKAEKEIEDRTFRFNRIQLMI